MTIIEMEKRLVLLGRRNEKTPSADLRAEYRALYERWMRAKAQQRLDAA